MKIIKRIAISVMAVALAGAMMTGCIKYESPADQTYPTAEGQLTGLHHVEIEVQDYGTISVELDADTAPRTVTNFINLANSGFYNGLTFHRIITGFMIQGGDPEGNGMGGADETIVGEFSANGIENNISHVRGVISMARNGQSYNSASSQFFIVQADSIFLDGNYAGFGHVTDGMDIVDEICANTPVTDDNGTVLPQNQPVITEVRVID
ncbi:MAG: peptidylprolyl isomerase [Clostridiales bacterium]|nr:peptidylprolyl isomerase [Clostridiales bacterium]